MEHVLERRALRVASFIVLAALLFAVSPAGAWQGSRETQAPEMPVYHPESEVSASLNWSGYVAEGGQYSAVSGTWIVPDIEAGNYIAAEATWVGIGGVHERSLIQAGTESFSLGNGDVAYLAWYELLPAYSIPVDLCVEPGDTVTVTIQVVGEDIWRISIRNVSRGDSFELTVPYESSYTSAEWVVEMPSLDNRAFIPLADFNEVRFLNAYAVEHGEVQSIRELDARPVLMENYIGETLAIPSHFFENQSSFTVARTSAFAYSRLPRRVVPTVVLIEI